MFRAHEARGPGYWAEGLELEASGLGSQVFVGSLGYWNLATIGVLRESNSFCGCFKGFRYLGKTLLFCFNLWNLFREPL